MTCGLCRIFQILQALGPNFSLLRYSPHFNKSLILHLSHPVATRLGQYTKRLLRNPQEVAQEYEKDIRTFFGLKVPSDKPSFDLVFLGIGADGHTASLFPDGIPGAEVTDSDPDRLVIAPWVIHLNDHRFSLTPAAFNSSKEILFLVREYEKASILQSTLKTGECSRYPAQFIQPRNGRMTWLVDKNAASLLPVDLNT